MVWSVKSGVHSKLYDKFIELLQSVCGCRVCGLRVCTVWMNNVAHMPIAHKKQIYFGQWMENSTNQQIEFGFQQTANHNGFRSFKHLHLFFCWIVKVFGLFKFQFVIYTVWRYWIYWEPLSSLVFTFQLHPPTHTHITFTFHVPMHWILSR